ncbi:calcium-dependent phosphotriesterase [Martensiomyces pterosporus]|nr:calcium-dependent phosphotriesterase [Martensiomyces pterosporus]
MATLGLSKLRTWAAVVAVAIAAAYIYPRAKRIGKVLGIGATYSSVNTTSCHIVGQGDLHGCEDIVVDPETGLAYLACGALKPRQRWLFPDNTYDLSIEAEADSIYVMDERDQYSELRVLEHGSDGRLQPFSPSFRVHGFDIYWNPADSNDMTFIFVNHQLGGKAVSIFSHVRGTDFLVHVETVRSELLISPNNILALSKRSFYVTNDMKYARGLMREVSNSVLRLPNTYVLHRSESGDFRVAAEGIRSANGIARYGEWVYVTSCGDPSIHIYRIGQNSSLTLQSRTYYDDSIPDNLFVDPLSGQIYSTGFLKLLELYKLFKDPSPNTTSTAATKIRRLTQRADPKEGFDIETLLVDSGALMPTATVAAIQRRNNVQRLLVGCVMCNHLAVCDSVI